MISTEAIELRHRRTRRIDAMDVLEFLCGLLELIEPLSIVFDIVAWLFRSAGRLVRWIMLPSREQITFAKSKESRVRTERGHVLHLSLTRRRRGKWQGASYVVR
jgi:hypothetical protein